MLKPVALNPHEWRSRAKFFRRARHAVPLLKPNNAIAH